MANILSGLNPAQKKAVVHAGSPLLVLAGAGSGKTRVLTHRAAHFIQTDQAKPDQVLLLTFTNKAAEEMKIRMSKLLSTDSKSLGLFAGTFHSFCCRILRRDGYLDDIDHNFVIYDTNDQESLIKNILNDLDLSSKEFKPKSLLYFIENNKNSFFSPSDATNSSDNFWAEHASRVYKEYQKRLKNFQALDFTDLLYKTIKLFHGHPEILEKYQKQYQQILVDEYQDTNQIQYLLTRLLATNHQQITAVGDASQAIYGWRGADYKNLVNFTKDFKSTTTINLEQNYRSTQIILNAANAVISKNDSHPVLKLFTEKKSTDKITLYQADSELSEAEFVAQKIKFLETNLHIPLSSIAVLYRMNAQSRVLEEAFLRHSIPYVLIGGTRFYERAEIKDVLSMLRFVNNPADKISLQRVEKALGKRRLARFMEHISGLNLDKLSSSQLMESIVTNSGYLEKFDPKKEEDQRRIENIKELKSVATTHPKLNDFLENVALVQQEYSLQEKNKKKDNKYGVKLMTLHGSKGLEFDAVFLVGFEEGILPHSRSMTDQSQIEEERRLCYVGITRARDYLYISFASRRLYFGKSSLNEPSRFLADIPSNLVESESVTELVRDYRRPNSSTDDLIYDPDIY